MDVHRYIESIQYLKNDLPKNLSENVYPEVANICVNSFKERIFDKGLDADNDKIGNYSEKSTSVNQKQFINKASFIPNSKNGKTMKLKNGYKELKQVQGMKSDSVNLVYSGDLKNSVQSTFNDKEIIIGFTDMNNANKAELLERKYNKTIFKLSETEKQKIKELFVSFFRTSKLRS